MEEGLWRTSLAPPPPPLRPLLLYFGQKALGVEREGLLDLPGQGRDRVHSTVEPSPCHIRCRVQLTKSVLPALLKIEGVFKRCPEIGDRPKRFYRTLHKVLLNP